MSLDSFIGSLPPLQVPRSAHTSLRGLPNTKNQRGALGRDALGRECRSRKIMIWERFFVVGGPRSVVCALLGRDGGSSHPKMHA